MSRITPADSRMAIIGMISLAVVTTFALVYRQFMKKEAEPIQRPVQQLSPRPLEGQRPEPASLPESLPTQSQVQQPIIPLPDELKQRVPEQSEPISPRPEPAGPPPGIAINKASEPIADYPIA